MSLAKKLNQDAASTRPNVTPKSSSTPFTPVRTEDYKIDPKAKLQWLVIEPDIFPGEDIVVVMRPEYLAEAEKENPGLVIYTLSEIDALIPFEHDTQFRKKIHLAKKTFGGHVKPADVIAASTV